MRAFFQPSDGPEWLGRVLLSIRGALNDIWDNPFGLWRVATADLPAAADYGGRLAYNVTSARVTYSDAAAWKELQPYDATLAALASYNTNGFLVQTAADTFAGRSLAAPAAGLTITNPAGTAGNPTFALANDLAAIEALSGTNTIYYRSGVDTWSAVTIGSTLTFSAGTLSVTGAAVTKTDDTNVTLALGGTPTTGAVNAFSLTLGWTGTLAATRGGTGTGSYAVGDILYASTTTALSKLADVATGNALISGGVGVAPSWGKVGLTTHVSGTLPVANGGTGDTGTAWPTYTPTATAAAGTLTTVSTTGRSKQIGKTTFVEFSVTITNAGTGTTAVKVTLPFTAAAFKYTLIGAEVAATGKMMQGRIDGAVDGTYAYCVFYDNTYPGASGNTFTMSGTYEAA